VFVNTEIWLRDQFQLDDPSVDGEKVTWQEAAAAPFYERIGVAPVKFRSRRGSKTTKSSP
jgi:hypothetical protein